MRYQIVNNTSNTPLTDHVDRLVQDELRRIDPLVDSFPQDDVMLRVIIDDEAPSSGTEIKLRLSLPSRMITAHEASPRLGTAVDKAFDELRRQLVEHKQHLRREHEYKRKGGQG